MNAPAAVRAAPMMSARARARLLWLKLHRWVGLALLIAFLAIAVTGMALVWRNTTESIVHPDRVAAADTIKRAPASAIVAAGRAVMPGGALPVQYEPASSTGAAILTGAPNGPPILGIGPPRRARVWIDPADAQVLSVSSGAPDVVYVLKAVHGHLLVGSIGRWLMATAGLLLVFSSATGLYLWWPGVKNIARSLKWRKQFTRSMNLHRIIGPIAGLGLIAQGITGILIALPWLLALFDPAAGGGRTRPTPSPPLAQPQLSIDRVVAIGAGEAPAARLVTVQFPTQANPQWRLAYAGGLAVSVADGDGAASVKPPAPPSRSAVVESTISSLHEGGYGLIHQILLFACGAAFALFSITGLLLWFQGRRKKKR